MIGSALLNEAGRIHHVHAGGIARDHAEIVRDDDERDPKPAREILHQLEDLCLDRDVERGCRLIGDDKLRVAGEADCNHHALADASRELVRVLRKPALGVSDSDERE